MATETIPYTVMEKEGNIELRKYNNVLLASTKTDPSVSGFNNVFNYISGNNDQSTKISMTSPVVSYQEEDKLVTGFYVPSKYNKETTPQPSSPSVFINELEESLYAVIRFSGNWESSKWEKQDELLLDYINKNNLTITSTRLVMRYNPPYTPGFLRRNEIAYQVQKKPSQ